MRLPLSAASHLGGQLPLVSSLAPAGPRLRILVVDDNVDAAESLAMLLMLDGHETRVCHGGPEALAVASEFAPDAAFLDLGMPGMNGYELARALRAAPATHSTLLVALTGWGAVWNHSPR